MTTRFDHIYSVLSKSNTLETAGFLLGLSQTVGVNKRTLEYPGTSFFNGAIVGIVYTLGFGIVGSMCSKPVMCGLNSLLIASICYKQYNNLMHPPTDFVSYINISTKVD